MQNQKDLPLVSESVVNPVLYFPKIKAMERRNVREKLSDRKVFELNLRLCFK